MMMAGRRIGTLLLLLLASASAFAGSAPIDGTVAITIGHCIHTVARSFVAHGWEPWTALSAMAQWSDAKFVKALSHLRGQTIRFGGISADWLNYTTSATVTGDCRGYDQFTVDGQCPFSTGALDELLDLLGGAGINMLFDLNVLIGRNCTQKAHESFQTSEYCGDDPATWDTPPVRALLEHIHKRGAGRFVGLELGNELFKPKHIPVEVANADVGTAATLLTNVWGDEQPPRLYATGTNDCNDRNNSDTLAALQSSAMHASNTGLSFHSYPGNLQTSWDKYNLSSFVLNATWLRTNVVDSPLVEQCLAAWNAGPRAAGMTVAVTEAAAISGSRKDYPPDLPNVTSFIHGFFSIAQLGQYAQAGVDVLARWGVPDLFGVTSGTPPFDPAGVAHDLFLYALYNATVGPGVLKVSGAETGDALVYAHCAKEESFGTNGSVTVLATNPSDAAVTLQVSLTSSPRLEYVLTACEVPGEDDLRCRTPVLNGDHGAPLALSEDGALPPMPGAYIGGSAPLVLPARSQAFFVLLGAKSGSCMEEVESGAHARD